MSKNTFEPDFYFSDYVEMHAPRTGSKGFFDKHKTILQLILFMVLSLLCFIAQFVCIYLFEWIFKEAGYTYTVELWVFTQPLNSFIAFLIANVVAKTLSFIMNYKTTFKSNSNKLFSAISYTIMVVALIIIETVIAHPLADAYASIAVNAGWATYDQAINICTAISTMTYSMIDFFIVFIMDKFVIMRNVDRTPPTIETLDSGIVVDYKDLA